ncbi:MAG: DUF2141 domain-containing protein [Schleiferiaceae bacterium]|jgi:uncharacterized protein (DUF2141 family)|nr:DUF2141 domain-containing protein [Schleiferiaceae bacterium]
MLLSIAKKVGLLVVVVLLSSFEENSCDLTVKVTGLRNTKGHFRVSYWLKNQGFPNDSWDDELVYKKINSTDFTFTVKGLPYGECALAGLHDENEDGEMETNWVGFPKEGFCFSRNYKVVMRAPKWEESVFQLNKPQQSIEMKMQY